MAETFKEVLRRVAWDAEEMASVADTVGDGDIKAHCKQAADDLRNAAKQAPDTELSSYVDRAGNTRYYLPGG